MQLKIPLENSLAPYKKKVKHPLTGLYQMKSLLNDKFQAIVVKKNTKMKDSYSLNIKKEVINSENCVKLLGVETDNNYTSQKSK